MFQIFVPVTQKGLWREVACEIHIVGTLYGHLLWRHLVNMLALLGPWPETPLAEKSSRTVVYLLCLGVV